MQIRTLVFVVFFVVAMAGDGYAWGPATHVHLAETALQRLGVLPTAMAGLLARHALAYIYGNIAADVVFAKRWSRVKQACHHWATGFRLLSSCNRPWERAFAYGYLSHLAADTVAHGKFVPRQLGTGSLPINLGHFYWEMRVDALMSEQSWRRLMHILDGRHDAYHQLLRGHITETILPYEVNRIVFSSVNSLATRRGVRSAMVRWSRYTPNELSHSLLTGYLEEAVDRTQSVLIEAERSSVLQEDPNGTSALMEVHVRRKEQRRLLSRHARVHWRRLEQTRSLAPRSRV